LTSAVIAACRSVKTALVHPGQAAAGAVEVDDDEDDDDQGDQEVGDQRRPVAGDAAGIAENGRRHEERAQQDQHDGFRHGSVELGVALAVGVDEVVERLDEETRGCRMCGRRRFA
jgi:hypothetical protein